MSAPRSCAGSRPIRCWSWSTASAATPPPLVSTDSKIGRGNTPVDFNAIPVSAISRIEVLRDGAGAQYGSDAVAGVINVILDDGAEGGALEAGYGLHHTDVAPIDRTVSDGQTSFLSGKVGTTQVATASCAWAWN